MSGENSKATELETESKNRQRVSCLVKRGESKSLGLDVEGAEGAICGNEERLSVYLEILDVISL